MSLALGDAGEAGASRALQAGAPGVDVRAAPEAASFGIDGNLAPGPEDEPHEVGAFGVEHLDALAAADAGARRSSKPEALFGLRARLAVHGYGCGFAHSSGLVSFYLI
jgi:hypothetical protein